jgi:hypothetical protein
MACEHPSGGNMTKCIFFAFLAFVPVAVLAQDTPAAAPAAGEFHQRELAWMNALADKDAQALEAILAPEFSIIGATSTLDDPIGTREGWLSVGLKRPFPRHDVQILAVTAVGDTAVVQAVLSATYPPSPFAPEGGPVSFLVTDTWVKRGGTWQVLTRHASFPHRS